MCYVKAQDIFPKDIIEIIQQYVQGECVYIPKREDNKKSWGEKTNTRSEIKLRNLEIYEEYRNGRSKDYLAEKYFLSKKSIERIILQERKHESYSES